MPSDINGSKKAPDGWKDKEGAMEITWIGHSCFRIEEDGYSLIIDPYEDGSVPGLANVRESADAVLCTHEHGDHNFRDGVTLKDSGKPALRVEAIDTFHDDEQGIKRGRNRIYIISGKTARIAHMGDLGCVPCDMDKLRGLDAVLIPVGGFFTIDGKTAADIIKKIKPRIAIPMHYCNHGFGFDVLSSEKAFTECFCNVIELDRSSLEIPSDYDDAVIVLTPERKV